MNVVDLVWVCIETLFAIVYRGKCNLHISVTIPTAMFPCMIWCPIGHHSILVPSIDYMSLENPGITRYWQKPAIGCFRHNNGELQHYPHHFIEDKYISNLSYLIQGCTALLLQIASVHQLFDTKLNNRKPKTVKLVTMHQALSRRQIGIVFLMIIFCQMFYRFDRVNLIFAGIRHREQNRWQPCAQL